MFYFYSCPMLYQKIVESSEVGDRQSTPLASNLSTVTSGQRLTIVWPTGCSSARRVAARGALMCAWFLMRKCVRALALVLRATFRYVAEHLVEEHTDARASLRESLGWLEVWCPVLE